jgi:hypothetical protein
MATRKRTSCDFETGQNQFFGDQSEEYFAAAAPRRRRPQVSLRGHRPRSPRGRASRARVHSDYE